MESREGDTPRELAGVALHTEPRYYPMTAAWHAQTCCEASCNSVIHTANRRCMLSSSCCETEMGTWVVSHWGWRQL